MRSGGMPKAQATFYCFTDVEVRKHGDQRGLDTPVVHAVNDENSLLEELRIRVLTNLRFVTEILILSTLLGVLANALNSPPEEYDRKVKTQRNRRGLTQVVEHVV